MADTMFDPEVFERVKQSGVIAVLELEHADDAVPVVDALLKGGITAIELTLRTAAAIPSIEIIAEQRPEMTIGVGTVIFPDQVAKISRAGAHFGVSPGFNPVIIDEALRHKLPFAPGIATPSELELAISRGCSFLKFFPAEPCGGIAYLKSMNAPYSYLGLTYIPLGGINEEKLPSYAAMKEVKAIGGSWIAPKNLITEHAWSEISRRAASAKQIWDTGKRIL
jgi:2-dehydro-3-deoxyphosphogluconate aldolase/(4S)-4-hydroxy-2-oxoglutarate aldolase